MIFTRSKITDTANTNIVYLCSIIEENDKFQLGVSENKNIFPSGVPVLAQQKQIRLGTMRLRIQFPASLGGLRIQHCCEL